MRILQIRAQPIISFNPFVFVLHTRNRRQLLNVMARSRRMKASWQGFIDRKFLLRFISCRDRSLSQNAYITVHVTSSAWLPRSYLDLHRHISSDVFDLSAVADLKSACGGFGKHVIGRVNLVLGIASTSPQILIHR